MRITSSCRDTKRIWETLKTEVVFGRAEEKWPIILDLSPDQEVSRLHGRIWEEECLFWIEDLNSSRGTQLNGIEKKGLGKRQLQPDDSILVGQTTLKIEFAAAYRVAKRPTISNTALFFSLRSGMRRATLNFGRDEEGILDETPQPHRLMGRSTLTVGRNPCLTRKVVATLTAMCHILDAHPQ